jgi:hypothetical protein
MTAVAILAPRAAHVVTVTSAPGSSRTIPLHPLEPRQARATNLQRFRYASLVVRGAWCAERVVTRASGGAVLWDSGPPQYPCDPS